MSTRQTLVSAIVLGLVCAGVVWWLESFNRERLVSDFRKALDDLPTFMKETPDV